MNLPSYKQLEIKCLNSIFQDTTNSYKFYWFLSILDEVVINGKTNISFHDLSLSMLSKVWYPLDYYKLSFGKQDGLKPIAQFLNDILDIDNSVNSPLLENQITSKLGIEEQNLLSNRIKSIIRWVPYRFIRPFYAKESSGLPDFKVNNFIIELSLKDSKTPSPYKLFPSHIEVNSLWIEYFHIHYNILKGFINWHLVRYLQKHNPNVIGLSEKLEKPIKRDLTLAKTYWKQYLVDIKSMNCIYSGIEVNAKNMSLDHFIPWSYVAHDKIWNIVPTLVNINSQKGNWLPSLELYLESFLDIQLKAYNYHKENGNNKLLEDYLLLFQDSKESSFKQLLGNEIYSNIQIAKHLGFKEYFKF